MNRTYYTLQQLVFILLVFFILNLVIYSQTEFFNPDTKLKDTKGKNIYTGSEKNPTKVEKTVATVNSPKKPQKNHQVYLPSDSNAYPKVINNLFLGARVNLVLGYGNDNYSRTFVRPSVYVRLEYLFHRNVSFLFDLGYKQNTLHVTDTLQPNADPVEWFSDYVDLQFSFAYNFYLYNLFKWKFIKYFRTSAVLGIFAKFPTTSSIFLDIFQQTLNTKQYQNKAIPGIVIGLEFQVSYHILRYLYVSLYYLRTFTNILNKFNAVQISVNRITLSEFQIGLGIKYPIFRAPMVGITKKGESK